MVLMFLRLMMPPGICACQYPAPAAALFANLAGAEAPVPPPDNDDDHAPGCPASDLAQGMGLQPAGPPHPALDLARALDALDAGPQPPAPALESAPAFLDISPQLLRPPLFRTDCALRI
jgi:hypothetical protein